MIAERDAARSAVTTNEARKKLTEERLSAALKLQNKGLIAGEEVRRREEAVIAIDQGIVDARAREATLNARLSRAIADRSRLPHDAQLTRGQLEAQLAALAQRRAHAEAGKGYEVRAHVAGRVSALQAGIGQALEPSRPLMTVTPESARLAAELYLPSRAIGFIEAGQNVRLLYDAFPYQRFGPASGTVEAISDTVLFPQEVQAALEIKEPVYRVIVQLDRQQMQAFGRDVPLSAGMALTADIVLEKRTFAEWLFEPLFATRGRM